MSMEDLLRAIMGGSTPQQSSQGGGLEDILGAIMGAQGGMPQQSSQGGGLEDILGAIMGAQGGMPQQSSQGGGLMDIIGAIMGGAGGQSAGVSPIIEGVSGKTGLSQMIVQMILSFVMGKLLGGAAGGAGGLGGLLPGLSGESNYSQPQQPSQGLDLDSLLEQMGQDDSMADELAQQTGLDAQTAQKGLQEVLGALGAQRQASGRAPSQTKQGGLDDLLENW